VGKYINIFMKGMTLIVKKTTQLMAGLIFLYGIYVIIHGHLTPGGGFAGGVLIAGMLFGAKVFFLNWLPKGTLGELVSAGMIPLYNIFIGIEVAASILSIFLALVIFKEEISE
jgi:multisubunit Na+/H+ antiporter MnhB subunit